MKYHKERVISGPGVEGAEFAQALRGLAVDAHDRLYAVGDSKVVVFTPQGKALKTWMTERPGFCAAVSPDEKIYVGEQGQVQVFDAEGKLLDTWRDEQRMQLVCSIDFASDAVLLADVGQRCIRRYDKTGRHVGDIGRDNRMKGFLIPNRQLDFVVDAKNVIHACNPGKHRVEHYSLEGKLLGRFGRFGGGSDPTGFTGCCNPTNVALLSGGRFAVTTKAEPLVKIYSPEGKMLALFGAGDFDPGCKNMDAAVDSTDRIYVIDTVNLRIIVYAPDKPEASTDGDDRKAGKP